MIALLLAQLVMPSPSVEPLSPPGMVCMGECSDGPMVWRASPARGRLVVACDMRSSTCSDGRQITTTRATPVPCEVSPGVWEMVGVDEGCYGVRGLESWAATTSYLSFGAELDRSPWQVTDGTSIAPLPDGGYRVCQDTGTAGIRQYVGNHITPEETFTLAGLLRANTAPRALVGLGNVFNNNVALPAQWGRVSHGGAFTSGTAWASFFPRPSGAGQCIDILAAWLTKTDTPGRACWGGEAPVTCAADRHTISTEGWPTESGEISVAFVSGDPTAPERRTLFAGGAASSCRLWTTPSGNLQIANCPGWSASLTTTTVSIQEGRPYVATIKRRDGKASIWLDGVMQVEEERPPFVWDPSVNLGTTGTVNHLNGSISSLTVRSYEEVSP